MEAWQKPENIYLTFGSVYNYALNPFSCRPYLKYFHPGDSILEYGCGLAPITTSLIKTRAKKINYTIADIRCFTYHYAKFKLKQHGVDFIDIIPYQPVPFRQSFNIIFLMTVLEHLPNPLQVVKQLTENIDKSGHIVFDYILSSGGGLDTKESIDERRDVLNYIQENFDIVEGKLKYDQSMGTTIGRKK